MALIPYRVWIRATAGLLLLLAACDAGAQPRGRDRGGDREPRFRPEAFALSAEVRDLQRQVDSLRKDVQKAEEEYDKAKKERDKVRKELEKADSAARDTIRRLTEVTQRVEETEPTSSPFGRAKAAGLAARAAYDAAVAKAESEAGYQTAYEQAKTAADRATAVREVRKQWIDGNSAVAETLARWRSARTAYESLRDVLLHKNADWERAAKEASETRRTRDALQRSSDTTAAVQHEGSIKRKLTKLEATLKKKSEQLDRALAAERQMPPDLREPGPRMRR